MCFQEVSRYSGRRPASSLALSPSTQAASVTTKRRFYFQRAVEPIMCSRSSNIADVFWRKLVRRPLALAVWLPVASRRLFLFLFAKTTGTHDHMHVRRGRIKTTEKLRRYYGDRQPPSFWTRRWTESLFQFKGYGRVI